MSVIEEAIRSKLLSDAAVTGVISERLYVSELPQNPTYPAAIYEKLDSERDYTLQGPSGFVSSTIQIIAYAASYSTVKDLSTKIRQSINGIDGLELGVKILGVFLQNESDEYDDDLEVNSGILEYTINHDEVV